LSFAGRFGTIPVSEFRDNPVSLSGALAGFASRSDGRARWGRAAIAAAVMAASVISVAAKEAPTTEMATVALAALPAEAQATERLIRTGGPFPYPKDGSVFGNRERQLPSQRRGYYREYTVTTPGARNRAAKRIVCGGYQVTTPQACYYTDDHYASFRRIVK
jgi:ribonuclease T1